MIAYVLTRIIKKMRGSAVRGSLIHRSSRVESGSQLVNVSMDRHTFCGYDCTIIRCTIGSFTSIGNQVVIGGGMHPITWISTSPTFYKGRDSVAEKFSEHERDEWKHTVIGHDVWIGERAIIKQGVRIGTGSIIGMGSVVTRDVEPYTIVAGNPAKIIRRRFSEDTTAKILGSKWWTLPDERIRKAAKFAQDPEQFLSNL